MKAVLLFAVLFILPLAALGQEGATDEEKKFLFDRACKNIYIPGDKFNEAVKFLVIHKDGGPVLGKALCYYRAKYDNKLGSAWQGDWDRCYACYRARMKGMQIPDEMIPELIFALGKRVPHKGGDNGRLELEEIQTIAGFGKKAIKAVPALECVVEYSTSDVMVLEARRAIKKVKGE